MKRMIAVLLLLLSGVACGEGAGETKDEAIPFLRATESRPRSYTYTVKTAEHTLVVNGRVADNFRYAANASLDGKPAFETVVSDDAIALRDLGRLKDAYPAAAAVTAPSGDWVVDGTGAPQDVDAETEEATLGADPVRDAMRVFAYAEAALRSAVRVRIFEADSLEYNPAEDPFPTPDPDSDVVRYDISQPALPTQAQIGGGTANQAVPGIEHFRKMSIYVQNGRVVRILEAIDVASRLDDLERNYEFTFPANVRVDERVRVAVDAINALRTAQGVVPMSVRAMSMEVRDSGEAVTLTLPANASKGKIELNPAAGVASSTGPAGVLEGLERPEAAAGEQGAGQPSLGGLLGGATPRPEAPAKPPSAPVLWLWFAVVPVVLVAAGLLALRGRRPAALRAT